MYITHLLSKSILFIVPNVGLTVGNGSSTLLSHCKRPVSIPKIQENGRSLVFKKQKPKYIKDTVAVLLLQLVRTNVMLLQD